MESLQREFFILSLNIYILLRNNTLVLLLLTTFQEQKTKSSKPLYARYSTESRTLFVNQLLTVSWIYALIKNTAKNNITFHSTSLIVLKHKKRRATRPPLFTLHHYIPL